MVAVWSHLTRRPIQWHCASSSSGGLRAAMKPQVPRRSQGPRSIRAPSAYWYLRPSHARAFAHRARARTGRRCESERRPAGRGAGWRVCAVWPAGRRLAAGAHTSSAAPRSRRPRTRRAPATKACSCVDWIGTKGEPCIALQCLANAPNTSTGWSAVCLARMRRARQRKQIAERGRNGREGVCVCVCVCARARV